MTRGIDPVLGVVVRICVEIEVVLVTDWIGLHEPSERGVVHPCFVIVQAEFRDICLAGVLESPLVRWARDSIRVVLIDRQSTAIAVGDVDSSVIALWLGHESVNTTQAYLHAHLALKEAALAKTTPLNVKAGRFRPDDRLLSFLNAL